MERVSVENNDDSGEPEKWTTENKRGRFGRMSTAEALTRPAQQRHS